MQWPANQIRMTQTQIPPFQPGMQFRQLDITGSCTVLEETKEDPSTRMVFYKIPDGPVRKTYSHALYRRLYITQEFIEEPELKQANSETRVWIAPQKKMVYDTYGIVKYGEGWNEPKSEHRFFKLFLSPTDPASLYHERDLTIMHSCNVRTGDGQKLFSYDVLLADNDSAKNINIIIPGDNHFTLVDYNNSKQTLSSFVTVGYNKVGNIFENPEYYDIFVKSRHVTSGK